MGTFSSRLSAKRGVLAGLLLFAGLGSQAQIANVRTLAGSGGGLDSTGTTAQLNSPYHLALSKDSSRIFIAESIGNALRQVTVANRRTQVLAGRYLISTNRVTAGSNSTATFNAARGVAHKNDSIVYVSSFGLQAGNFGFSGVSRVNLRTGQTTVLNLSLTAGWGLGIAPGATQDTLYVFADNIGVNEVIVNAGGGVVSNRNLITRASGTGVDLATAIRQVSYIGVEKDSLWISDYANNRVIKASRATGAFTIINTTFNQPTQIARLNDTTLVVGEFGGNRISLLNLRTNNRSLYVNTGNNVAGVVANDTAVFFSEPGQNRLRYVLRSAPGTIRNFIGQPSSRVDGPGTVASFRALQGITIGPDSALYVAEGGSTLRRVDTATGATTTITLPAPPAGAVNNRALYSLTTKGDWIYFTENSRNSVFRVGRYNPRTGRQEFFGGLPALTGPTGTLVDGDSTTSRFKFPSGIVVNASGTKVYVGDDGGGEGAHTIRVIDIATKTTSSYAGGTTSGLVDGPAATARFNNPEALAIWGDSILFVADNGNDRIRKIDLRTNVVSTFVGTGTDVRTAVDNANGLQARIASISNLQIDTLRRLLYFTDGELLRVVELFGTNRVRTLAGNSANFADGIARQALFNSPGPMALLQGSNKLFISDRNNNRIRRVTFFLNTAPTFTKGADVRVFENAPLTVIPNWASGIARGANAIEFTQGLTFQLFPDRPTLFQTQPTVDSLGTLRFRPAVNQYGTTTVRIRLRDNGGVEGGGIDSAVSQFFTITIDSVNSAPVLTLPAASQTITTPGNGQPVTLASWATAVAASGAPNFELAQTLSISISTTRPQLYSTVPAGTVNANGTISLNFATAVGAVGRDTLRYVLRDNGGTANGGVDTLVGTFVINITAYVNAAPTGTVPAASQTLTYPAIVGGAATTVANILTTVTAGPTADNWQSLTATVRTRRPDMYTVAPSLAIVGTTARTGTLTFTLSGQPGTDTLTLVLRDNGGIANGGVDSLVRTVRVVVGANQAPTFTVTAANLVLSYPAGATNTVNLTNWATAVTPGPAAESPQTLSFTIRSKNPAIYATQPSIAVVGTGNNRTATLSFVLSGTNGSDTAQVVLRDNGGILGGGVDSLVRQLIVNVGVSSTLATLPAGSLKLYPNPSRGIVYLEASQLPFSTGELQVVDAIGRVVYAQTATIAAGTALQLDLTALNPGAYVVRFNDGERQAIRRVVIE